MIGSTVFLVIVSLVCIFINVHVMQNSRTRGLARFAFVGIIISFLAFVGNVISLIVNLTGPV